MSSTDISPGSKRSSLALPVCIWAVFAAGLLLQLFSPHLQIAHNAFVMPADAVSRGLPIDPRALVQRERMVQIFSALLALAGAIGLAVYYRPTLVRSFTGRGQDQTLPKDVHP